MPKLTYPIHKRKRNHESKSHINEPLSAKTRQKQSAQNNSKKKITKEKSQRKRKKHHQLAPYTRKQLTQPAILPPPLLTNLAAHLFLCEPGMRITHMHLHVIKPSHFKSANSAGEPLSGFVFRILVSLPILGGNESRTYIAFREPAAQALPVHRVVGDVVVVVW